MRSLSLKFTSYFVMVLFVATPLLAETDADGPIVGSATITKTGGKVRAFADATASNAADDGWYWIHARVLPYHEDYAKQASDTITGYFYKSVYVRRTGQKKNGRAYCSMWAQSSQGYHSVLIDLPE